MLSFLPYFVRGVIASILLALNTLILSIPLLLTAVLKLIIPFAGFRRMMGRVANWIAELWISVNSLWMRWTQKLGFHVQGVEKLDRNNWYLVIANHQSWADIFIMQHVLNKRIPFMKFFLKQELIWVPVIGLCWWALEFPFMKRYSKSYLAKYPEKKGKDLEATRKACEKFKHTPVAIVNYLEGTRFTKAKHQAQASPYQNLLKPKAGGISYVVGAMGEQVRTVVDITLCYNQPYRSFWDFLCGRVERLSMTIDLQMIPESFAGKNYQNDPVFREEFQLWVNELWENKDRRLSRLSNTVNTPVQRS